MTGINIEIKRYIITTIILISAIEPCSSILSDRRLCFDPQCSVPVSTATTLLNYNSNNPDVLSFEANVDVLVYSKEAGKIRDFWGVEINGKRGYVPLKMIKEKRVMKKFLLHVVPTEAEYGKTDENSNLENAPNEKVARVPTNSNHRETENLKKIVQEQETIPDPSSVMPSFEVHDGTTIPLSMNEEIREPSYSTIVPRESVADIGEQPTLSVHPNIASSSTSKNRQNDMSANDDNENMKNDLNFSNSREEDTTIDGIFEKGSKETFNEIDEFTANDENTSSNAENSSYPEELVNKADETSLESIKIDDQAQNIDSPESAHDNTNDEPENSADLDEPVVKEEIINAISQESPREVTNNDGTRQNIENNSPDTTTQASSSELLENNGKTDKNGENNIRAETIAEDSIISFDDKTENSADSSGPGSTDFPEMFESSEARSLVIDLSSSDDHESEKTTSTKSLPINPNEIQQSVEEKIDAETPLNLNIVNPLFNRVSMLPSIVSEVVNSISPEYPDTKTPKEMKLDEVTETTIDGIPMNNNSNSESLTKDNILKNDIDGQMKISVDTAKDGVVENIDQFENNNNNNSIDSEMKVNYSTADTNDTLDNSEFIMEQSVQPGIYEKDELSGFRQENFAIDETTTSFNGFPANRNLLNVGSGLQHDDHNSADSSENFDIEKSKNIEIGESKDPEVQESKPSEIAITEKIQIEESVDLEIARSNDEKTSNEETIIESPSAEKPLEFAEIPVYNFVNEEGLDDRHWTLWAEVIDYIPWEAIDITHVISIGRKYWEILTYLVLTAFTSLLFSLGYYYIENSRRDGRYIAKINKLEKELLVCIKECTVLDDTLKSTKNKLDSIEDESFGSNEMVASLKVDLEASKTAKSELEEQVGMLEKELESATEAGLELERMLREILSTNNAENPLAQSVEDLQTRLNAQQAANEALTNALNLKAQENETLISDLKAMTQKSEQLEVEVSRITEELKHQNNIKSNFEQTLMEKVENLEKQVKDITAERINLRKQLKGKEMEMKDLLEVVNQMNINNLDFEKLYNVSRVKAEAGQLLEERDELKIRLSEVEGAHQLLEEHVKLINEEVSSLSEQCKLAEKAKRDAETRVEVLSNYFKEKEAQRQKEEAVWLEKQGEVSSTVERLHTLQNEIHNYKQQIEMLKREILDQESEYKNQIATMETKSHEQWVIARQNERRLEESKAEAGQLRNRLTLIEKNLNDMDPEAKLHRLETNGDTALSPQLFMGAEASSSPIMFAGSSGVPLPPPPSYLYGPPVPPFIPPPPHTTTGVSSYEVGQRPPPLGGRLSSPPPLHPVNTGRYENLRSSPSPLSPTIMPPYGPPHRAYPPPFPNDRLHPPPPPPPPLPAAALPPSHPHSSILPPLSSHNWPNEALPPLRNSGFQPHQQQQQQQHQQHHHHHHHHRDNQRARNHKGSLHSSGESLDKNL